SRAGAHRGHGGSPAHWQGRGCRPFGHRRHRRSHERLLTETEVPMADRSNLDGRTVARSAGTRRQLEDQLVAVSRRLHARGWVANHDGNVTARLNDGRFLATPTAF